MKFKREPILKRIALSLFILFMCLLLVYPFACISDDVIKTIEVDNHVISLEKGDNLVVDEEVLFNYTLYYHSSGSPDTQKSLSYNGSLYFWISDKSTDLTIECQGLDIGYIKQTATNVSINLAENNLSIQPNGYIRFNLSYSLPPPFSKELAYRTHAIQVIIISEDYPRGTIPLHYDSLTDTYVSSLKKQDSSFSFNIDFVSPPSCPMWNMFSLILLVLVLLLIITLSYFVYRPQKNKIEKEPIEALELRKKLLMDVLKTLEVERGKGKVPDTYYSIIKDDYKKEAVRIIQELERRK
jgi:preprotein translocase subunit YajC